jgi:hypothetical protein
MRQSHVIAVGTALAAIVAALTVAPRSLAGQSLGPTAYAVQSGCATCSGLASATFIEQPNLGDWSSAATPDSAQKKDDAWHFTLAPYILFPQMQGTSGIGNLPPVKVNVTASEIFSHLQIGGMFYFQASKGPWSFALDGIYMDLKQNITPDSSRLSGSVSLQQGLLEGFVFRHISKPVELMVGGLGVHIQEGITVRATVADTIAIEKARNGGEAWGLPVVGVRWTPIDDEHWHVVAFGDIGGLSSNNWGWQALASVGYQFSHLFELALQYRALAADYTTGSGSSTFKYDVTTFGPQLGFIFHL